MCIPTYAINLHSRPDRWGMLSENLDRIGLPATRITRIAAVDKATLCEDPGTRWMGVGHVACLRSHCRAMEAFLATTAPAALILEDDAELHSDLPGVIACLDWWPEGHGLVHLECIGGSPWLGRPVGRTGFGHEVRPILEKYQNAAGYLIDRRTATEFLTVSSTARMPVDSMLFNPNWSGFARRARPLQLVPAPVRQRPTEIAGSDTGDGRVGGEIRFRPSRTFRCPHKFRMRLRSALTGDARRMPVPFGSCG